MAGGLFGTRVSGVCDSQGILTDLVQNGLGLFKGQALVILALLDQEQGHVIFRFFVPRPGTKRHVVAVAQDNHFLTAGRFQCLDLQALPSSTVDVFSIATCDHFHRVGRFNEDDTEIADPHPETVQGLQLFDIRRSAQCIAIQRLGNSVLRLLWQGARLPFSLLKQDNCFRGSNDGKLNSCRPHGRPDAIGFAA
jgi:hypothetical protein